MKKVFSIICFCLCLMCANAQQVVDNKGAWYISGNVGTNIWDNYRSWEDPNDVLAKIAVGKEITPIFGLEVDMMAGMNQGSKLFFDSHNLSANVATNLTNLVCGYKGHRRVFESIALVGAGWYHAYTYNDVSVNGTLRCNFNITDNWALNVTPEYMFLPKAELQKVNVYLGATYRFGKEHFPMLKLYDESEIASLNATINDLRAENNELKARKPVEVIKTDTVEITKTEFLTPAIQFLQNSSEIAATSYINVIELANHISETGKSYLIDGYASVEGSTEFNNKLSVSRAEAVKKALVECGVSENKLFVKGHGSTDQFGDLEFNRIVIVTEK